MYDWCACLNRYTFLLCFIQQVHQPMVSMIEMPHWVIGTHSLSLRVLIQPRCNFEPQITGHPP
jgi:hypothetical protein